MKKVVFILFMFLAISCSKEDYYTDGELIGEKISQVIAENQVDMVEVRTSPNDITNTYNANKFEVSRGMIFVSGKWYNLLHVKKFSVWTHKLSNGVELHILTLSMDEIQS
ncbi:MAG: hypothetical protein ACPGSG_11200 [Prolixibacteraceae bacterium]